jgi:DNA polymerase I-like protein with 3'-5' exonuclease and polymerase domains
MILTIDFETYYDKEYSLSKITTEEYVRHDLFEVIGVAVKVDDQETKWASGTKEQIKFWLGQFNWAESFVLAHNTMFDGAILSWQFGVKPMAWLDTLCMARAIDGIEVGNSLAKLATRYEVGVKGQEVLNTIGKRRKDFTSEEMQRYAEYCKNDVDLTYAIFKKMGPKFAKKEFKLIDLTLRMFTEPVLELNLPMLEQHLEQVRERKAKLLSVAEIDKEALMSNPKFAALLESLGVEPPVKISPTTGRETWAFSKNDEAFKELENHPDERVQALVAARIGTKSTLEETRTERFIGIAKRGTMPVPLRYYAAHTGRWGGDDKLNLQNIPRKSLLKKAIEPPEGHIIINADSSQIEARTVAWLAGELELVEAFDKGEDVYKIMASAIYGKSIEDITDSERFVGKTTILGAGYGMGAEKFKTQLKVFKVDLPLTECQRIISVYREKYSKIAALWKEAQNAIKAIAQGATTVVGTQPQALSVVEGGFLLPSGLLISYPDLQVDGDNQYTYASRRGRIKIYGGKAVENFTQGIARCAIGEQMLRVSHKYKVALTVHDSIVLVVKKEEQEEALKYVQTTMRWRPKWCITLPLNCEVEYGDSYGNTSKYAG